MAPKFDFKRIYSSTSERVKCLSIHPTHPWILVCLYNGQVHIHNYETQNIVKTFDICQSPIRAGLFVSRENWIICGADDFQIRVYNYNTLEKIHMFEAHADYLRYILAHPSKPLLITCSDDMNIKIWDWEKNWENVQKLEGHLHYVMQIAINPKNTNQLASGSLDKKIKIWNIGGSSIANFTLEGHDKGINTIDYCPSGDKPYLVSGADDWKIKIWDYQNKTCVHTLCGHTGNVLRVVFHPHLPFIASASEDQTLRIWDLATFHNQNTLNYYLGRIWSLSASETSSDVVIGGDNGMSLLRVGKEFPPCCMDSNAKVYFAKQTSICCVNLKNISNDVKNEEILFLSDKEIGTSEIYPQVLISSPMGRYIAVIGNGEFCVYSPIVLRSKIITNADRLTWSNDSNIFATSIDSQILLYKNFNEFKRIRAGFQVEDLFGGTLLAACSSSETYFYDWDELRLIIKIEMCSTNIYWNNFNQLCVCDKNSLHLLNYNVDLVNSMIETNKITNFGITEAFEIVADFDESVISGTWVNECFVFTNKNNRIMYLIHNHVFSAYHMNKQYFIIGYVPSVNRLFLVDKDTKIVSFALETVVIEFESAVLKKDYDLAKQLLPSIPDSNRNQLSLFLEDLKMYNLAIEVSNDIEHKLDLCILDKNVDLAFELAKSVDNKLKWKSLSKLAFSFLRFDIVVECYKFMKDPEGLFMLAISLNNSELLETALNEAISLKKNSLVFLIYYITGRVNQAVDLLKSSGRSTEACYLAFTHLPSALEETFLHWQNELNPVSPKQAARLVNPIKYPNMFPDLPSELIESMNKVKIDDQ